MEAYPPVMEKRNSYKDGNGCCHIGSHFDDNVTVPYSENANSHIRRLRVGIWESYHDNGQLWVRGKYSKDGTRDASWEYFDKTGEKF